MCNVPYSVLMQSYVLQFIDGLIHKHECGQLFVHMCDHVRMYLRICARIHMNAYLDYQAYLGGRSSLLASQPVAWSSYGSIDLPIHLLIYSINLLICPSIYPSDSPSTYPTIRLSICLSICSSIHLSIFLSVYLYTSLPIYVSIQLSIYPSIYLSV